MDRIRNDNVGWFPAQGSYEEAVLSWQEQIDQSFRRRDLQAQRTGPELDSRQKLGSRAAGTAAD